ncbi:hypothetical protein BGZ97_009725, partial [Linnemannia gamsii]
PGSRNWNSIDDDTLLDSNEDLDSDLSSFEDVTVDIPNTPTVKRPVAAIVPVSARKQ